MADTHREFKDRLYDQFARLGLPERLPADDPEPLRRALVDPAALEDDLAHNREVVRRWFSLGRLRDTLADLLARAGWMP